jgi:hypothetical protein
LLDHPNYVLGTTYNSYNSSSYNVAQQIARDCGFDFDGDQTNDSQVWLNYGLSRAKFLREVTTHAWSDSESAFISVVNRDSKLMYYNISKRRKGPSKWTFQSVSSLKQVPNDREDVIYIPETEATAEFGSDFMNVTSGYGIAQRYYDFTEGDEKFESPNDYKSFTRHSMISKNIKATRFVYGDINVGNFHKKFNLAKIQGFKFRSAYSTSLSLLSPVPKSVNLLDRASFTYLDRPNARLGSVLDGIYFVDRITHSITPTTYLVNYGLVREGINSSSSIKGLK